MKKTLVLILLLFLLFSTVVYAATTAVGTPVLTFSGTKATCKITVVQSGKPINVTLSLYQGSTLVDSWSKSGTSTVRIEEKSDVNHGVTYRLEASGTINGVPFTATPTTGTCP